MEPWISPYDATATHESSLSVEELRLIQEKESLTKAVEALALRRRAVATARLNAEAEIHLLKYPRRPDTEGADRSCEAERRPPAQPSTLRLVSEQPSVEEPLRSVECEKFRIVAAPAVGNNAVGEVPGQLTLEQRLRGEVEGLAAAQRKSIDAARARLTLLRKTAPVQSRVAR